MEKEETGAVTRDRRERIIRSLDFIQKGIGGPGKGLKVRWCVFQRQNSAVKTKWRARLKVGRLHPPRICCRSPGEFGVLSQAMAKDGEKRPRWCGSVNGAWRFKYIKMVFWFVKVKKVIQFPHVPSSKVWSGENMVRQSFHKEKYHQIQNILLLLFSTFL